MKKKLSTCCHEDVDILDADNFPFLDYVCTFCFEECDIELVEVDDEGNEITKPSDPNQIKLNFPDMEDTKLVKVKLQDGECHLAIGENVTYCPKHGKKEHGKVKSFTPNGEGAFVVYNCNGNWDLDHWKDYTAAATNFRDLVLGWI